MVFYHSIASRIESKDFNFLLFSLNFRCVRQDFSTTSEDSIGSIFQPLKFFACPTGKYHSAYSPYALNELNLALAQKILAQHEKNLRSFLSILDRMQWKKKPSHTTVLLSGMILDWSRYAEYLSRDEMGFKDQSLWRKYPNFPQRDSNLYVPHISGSMAQYLNVRRRKLGTIIIHTVHILHNDDDVTGSLSQGGIMPGLIQPISKRPSPAVPVASLHLCTNRDGLNLFGRSKIIFRRRLCQVCT
jgi:hypothetical protein